jgi:sugar lactone lactonase YvrE
VTDLLASGIIMGESPRWHGGEIWVADWIAGQILAFGADGSRRTVHEGLAMPFSFDWDREGRLLVIAGAAKQLLREAADGALQPWVDLASLCDKPWNEIVVDAAGNAYVNSIGFDMMAGEAAAPGIIALVTPDGAAREVAGGLRFPNGMAISPDGKTLVVAESHAQCLTAFDVEGDGGLTHRRVWADLNGDAPDGICFDAEGAIWYASVPGRHCVRAAEGGRVLQTVEADRGCFACMLGGEDGRTLYIVAQDWNGPQAVAAGGPSGQVLAQWVAVPHAGWP